jgi:hypothetical protein
MVDEIHGKIEIWYGTSPKRSWMETFSLEKRPIELIFLWKYVYRMKQCCFLNDVLPQVQREILGNNGISLAWRVGTCHPRNGRRSQRLIAFLLQRE